MPQILLPPNGQPFEISQDCFDEGYVRLWKMIDGVATEFRYMRSDNGQWVEANDRPELPPWARYIKEGQEFSASNEQSNQYFTMKPTKKKEKKPKFTEEEVAQAKTRDSVFSQKFPDSKPEEWAEYAGAGWVHSTELGRFMDSYRECYYSKKWVPINRISRTVEGYPISTDEIKANGWVKCQHSEYWAKKEDLFDAISGSKKLKIAKRYIDSGDYFLCDLGKKYYNRQHRINVRNSRKYQYVATQELQVENPVIVRCECCGYWYDSDQVAARNWERGRTLACTPCNNREVARALIRPHNFSEYPRPIFKKIENYRCYDHGVYRRFKKVEDLGIRLFGVEVETEMSKTQCKKASVDRLEMAKRVKETLGDDFVIIKEDGSLSLNGHYADGREGSLYAGFEVVSAPADIEVHRSRWTLLESMKDFNVLRAWDTDTCGMHVHVSKDALTTLQIGRILMLMTHKNNKKFVAKVAGRGENKYCRSYHKDKFTDGINYGEAEVRNGVEYIQASFSVPRSDEARRQAVNITNPRTIEFRIFRGTVHPRHIIRNIEFCDAVCSFCHPGSRSLQELADWRSLVSYIGKRRSDYPLLVEWMESKDVALLPYRDKAYGPKDARGTKRPDVVEVVHIKNEEPKEEGVAPQFDNAEDERAADARRNLRRLRRAAGLGGAAAPALAPLRYEAQALAWDPFALGAANQAVPAQYAPAPPQPQPFQEEDEDEGN